jgi:cell division septation protein DedD
MMTDQPVADYGSFETLNQPAADAGKTASNLSFFEILPQKVEMPPPPVKEASRAGTAAPTSAPAEPPADKLPADRPAGTPIKEGAYTIQVAAFLQIEKARALADTFISHGYPAQVVSKTDHKGATWHRVRVGSFKTPEEAQRLLPQLSQLASQPRIIPVQ